MKHEIQICLIWGQAVLICHQWESCNVLSRPLLLFHIWIRIISEAIYQLFWIILGHLEIEISWSSLRCYIYASNELKFILLLHDFEFLARQLAHCDICLHDIYMSSQMMITWRKLILFTATKYYVLGLVCCCHCPIFVNSTWFSFHSDIQHGC